MKQIKLTQGKFATVDDEDFEVLNLYTWFALKIKRSWYAGRKVTKDGGGQKNILMHHQIMQLPEGAIRLPQRFQIDHVNSDGLDNRKSNLRIATQQQQQANRRKTLNCTSKYKGVYITRNNSAVARIQVNGILKYIGSFRNEKDAALAYNSEAIRAFGEFARINIL